MLARAELYSKVKQKQLQGVGEFKAPKKEPMDLPKKPRTRRGSRKDSCSSDSGSEAKK